MQLDKNIYDPANNCAPKYIDNQWHFRVWAPFASSVLLVIKANDRSNAFYEMQPGASGYHTFALSNLNSGDRYGYSLDHGDVRPDPCALWQPDGVHKMSGLYDPRAFDWQANDWRKIERKDLVFYELHVGTFTSEGTFEAAIDRFDDLIDLGITAVELLPVSQFPGVRNWGYDGVHLMAAQNSYGGPAGLQRFIDAAHQKGLAVYLDLVLNHFGPEGNYVSQFGPYYSKRYTTPWGPAFNFDDRHSDPVRRFTLESIWHWIADFRFDGLRLDAVHAMFDIRSQHILADIKLVADAAAASNQREALVVVESLMNDVRMIRPLQAGGYGLDAEWNEDFHHAWLAYLIEERHGKYVDFGDVKELATVMQDTFSLGGRYSEFRGRGWGNKVGDLPGDRFIIGVQNHDHVGNRAMGERTGELLSPPMQRLSACLMLFSPYLPLIFMGEEYGETNPFLFFCSFEDPHLIANVRVGRQRDYDLAGEIPDPQSPDSFTRSKLSWTWQENPDRLRLRNLYKQLLAYRKQWPALQDTQYREVSFWPSADEPKVLVMRRGQQADRSESRQDFRLSTSPKLSASSATEAATSPKLSASSATEVEYNAVTILFNLTDAEVDVTGSNIKGKIAFASEGSGEKVGRLAAYECVVFE